MTIWRECRGSPKNILNMRTSTNETKEKHLRALIRDKARILLIVRVLAAARNYRNVFDG